jgi:pimeloyl-ACP methyl ester carboxylesterase
MGAFSGRDCEERDTGDAVADPAPAGPGLAGAAGHAGRAGRGRAWAAVSAAAVAGVTAAGLAAFAPAGASAVVPRVPGPAVPVLSWQSCQGSFQCATARVPLDYRQPRGAKITLEVIRHRAAGPGRRLGSLFFNSGGPAEQIGPFLSSFAQIPAAVRARFDIVAFDPRGFGFSTPVSCFPSLNAEHRYLAGLPLFPVGVAQQRVFEQKTAGFAAACAAHGGPLLDHDSTADTARDMDLLRRAVGDPVLNYLGQSYGTGLGAVYANLFPARAGHMVLDGNLDPVAWTRGRFLPEPLRQRADVGDAQTMQAFLTLCGKAGPVACAFTAGTPAATRAKFAVLARRLLRHPVTIGGSPAQTWTFADVFTVFPEFETAAWPGDAAVLQQLWLASARPPSPGVSPIPPLPALEQQFAVVCADSPNPASPRAYAAIAQLAFARAGGFGLQQAWQDEICATWPAAAAADRYTGPWNKRTAGTLLVIGNTTDPATPFSASVAMARDLARARLLTVHGFGHTAFTNPSTCATTIETAYLITGALPRPGTVCQQDTPPFGPPSP